MINLNIALTDDAKKANLKKLTPELYIRELVNKDITSIIELDNGFYYDRYLIKLFDSNDKEVKLTNIQKSIFIVLLENKGNIISIEGIIEKVWNTRDVSIFTFRNMIKKIREKTYYELIVNRSNHGYSINIEGLK